MKRREFLKNSLLAGLALKVGYDFHDAFQQDKIKYKIFHELPKHIYKAETHFETKEAPETPTVQAGNGIIYGGKYITMAHITTILPQVVRMGPLSMNIYPEVTHQSTMLHGRKLELLFNSLETDTAIFRLPKGFNLPDFPANTQYDRELGEEVYVIGDPGGNGTNIRKTIISRNSPPFETEGDILNVRKRDSFGLGLGFVPGDSGTPVVNSRGELLGICSYNTSNMGYAKEIKLFDSAKHM